MNFGERLIHEGHGVVIGEDTGRVVATFSHEQEAESFCGSQQSLAAIQAEAIELAMPEKATAENCNYTAAFCSGWNSCLKEFGDAVRLLKGAVGNGGKE